MARFRTHSQSAMLLERGRYRRGVAEESQTQTRDEGTRTSAERNAGGNGQTKVSREGRKAGI